MIKHLLAGAAAVVVVSGAALAQTPMMVPPGPPAAVDGDTTIRAGVTPDGNFRASTTNKSIDENGQEVKVNHTFETGVDGTTESHTRTQTDPVTGGTVTTTTTQEH